MGVPRATSLILRGTDSNVAEARLRAGNFPTHGTLRVCAGRLVRSLRSS